MKTRNILIFIWIAVLTFLSGFLNGTGLLLYANGLSHHTGNLTRAAIEISKFDFISAARILILPVSFFAGSFISGLLFCEKNFKFSKRYGILLMTFSLVLAVLGLFKAGFFFASPLICIILGIQNGMFIFYKGILIRTTHFTGYLTEAGFCLGASLSGTSESSDNKKEMKRSCFYLLSILCFIFGAACSVRIKTGAFFFSSLLYFICGLCYFTLRKLKEKD